MLNHPCQVKVEATFSIQLRLFAKEGPVIAARQKGIQTLRVDFVTSPSRVASLLLAVVMVLPFHLASYDIIPKGGWRTPCCCQGQEGSLPPRWSPLSQSG